MKEIVILRRSKQGLRYRFDGVVDGQRVGVWANAVDVETRSDAEVRKWIEKGLETAASQEPWSMR